MAISTPTRTDPSVVGDDSVTDSAGTQGGGSSVTDADVAAIVAYLEADGLRVTLKGVVHRADCRTQKPDQQPVVLPWPDFASDADRPCKTCRPALDTPPHTPAP